VTAPQASEIGVVYDRGRILHGFHEDQIRAYFSQFGDISPLPLSRNKRVRLIGYHFKFLVLCTEKLRTNRQVETLRIHRVCVGAGRPDRRGDSYLFMGHILTYKVISKDEVHPELWVGANREWRVVPTYRLAQAQDNRVSSVCYPPQWRLSDLGACSFETRSNNAPQNRKPSAEQTRGAETEACRGRDCLQLRQSWICECERCHTLDTIDLLLYRKGQKACHDDLCGSCSWLPQWLRGHLRTSCMG
jgi:hypothetical protein